MTVLLTEDQVDHIHKNYRGNKGGRRSVYSLAKAHGITFNEVYSVLRVPHEDAIKKARMKHRFVSYEPGRRYTPTEGELSKSMQMKVFGHLREPKTKTE